LALPTGGGTETLHSHLFEDVDAAQTLILGVQHHVYTVLSITAKCNVLGSSTNTGSINLIGYNLHGSASAATMGLAVFNIVVGETFVWNDKFSFNGYEPTGTPSLNAAGQIAVAAQAGSVAQQLSFTTTSSTDDFDVFVSYIDQDWS
tara:strand:- start:126 stop:566 length:441 start_codon:yes stop_codon:yes gene_type:complete